MEVIQNDRPSKLPPSLPTSTSSLRKSIIKISSSNSRVDSEQSMDKSSIATNGESTQRTRIIPIYRSISNSGANPTVTGNGTNIGFTNDRDIDHIFTTSDIRLPSYNFNYKSPFNRINFTISSPDPFSRGHSRISEIHSQKSMTDRCHSSMSSGYESNICSSLSSASSNHMPTSPEIRFREIRRTSSANRLYSGKQPSPQTPNSTLNNYETDESTNNKRSSLNKQQIKRFSLNENCVKEDVLKTLDQVEKRMGFFREIAFELFDEKSKLIEALNKINSCSPNTFTEVDLQDIRATTEDLINRLNSVDIVIKPIRSSTQVEAFERANKYVDALNRTLIKEGKLGAKKQCLQYISSCSSDDLADPVNKEMLGPIDERFQKLVIECSLDDQKIIKKKLKSFLEQIDKNQ